MNETKELESAFIIINNILKQKNERISALEEENKLLKIKLAEFETQQKNYNSNFNTINSLTSSSYLNIQDSTKKKNSIQKPFPPPVWKDSKFKGSNLNTIGDEDSYIIASPFQPRSHVVDNSYESSKFNNTCNTNMIQVNESSYNYNSLTSPTNTKSISIIVNDANSQSRNEIKLFLNEVKEKISSRDFKEFIKYIKILTDKSVINVNRKDIFENVKSLFGKEFKDLYEKFELLLSIRK